MAIDKELDIMLLGVTDLKVKRKKKLITSRF